MRRTVVIDDKLTDLIVKRDSMRIQISILRDRVSADTPEILALQGKVLALEDEIRAHQRVA